MAALPDVALPEVAALTDVTVAELDPLLETEVTAWDSRFAWDFRPSAELLRRFLQVRSLAGCALRVHGQIVGYTYYVCEARKGLIGDFYVRDDYAIPAAESTLLSSVVQAIMSTSGVRRIESQLMLLDARMTQIPFAQYLTRHDRFFMEIEKNVALKLQPTGSDLHCEFVLWNDRLQEEIAHLVAASYRGHVDSEINDQYRSIPGARHFLTNIVRFPGCGQFSPGASVVAVDNKTGRVCGVCLASLVSRRSGHITQLCVLPALRGVHFGYELLRQSLVRLVELGCQNISLTVTASNRDAIRLYESVGFRSTSSFPALVWEGF
jgi:ribosomal protein S18 acetylase RimI-like enzyme